MTGATSHGSADSRSATPEPLEQCDDGNTDDGDGCDNDCTFTQVLSIHASYQSRRAEHRRSPHLRLDVDDHGRALLGSGTDGKLGYANLDTIGDDEFPAQHTCALLADTNEVYCWGLNVNGELGYGNTNSVGDDEQPLDVGPVPLF